MRIALLPVGDVDDDILSHLSNELALFGDVEIEDKVDVPDTAYRANRKQYLASDLKDLTGPYSYDKVLAIIDADIYEDPLNFVFGLADIRGKSALISLHRLKDDNVELYKLRAAKEAFHELGHTFGLRHCRNRSCVMTFSNCLADTDHKEKDYCYFCTLRLRTAGIIG